MTFETEMAPPHSSRTSTTTTSVSISTSTPSISTPSSQIGIGIGLSEHDMMQNHHLHPNQMHMHGMEHQNQNQIEYPSECQSQSQSTSTSTSTSLSHANMELIDMEEESYYSQTENQYGDDNIWGLLSGVAGNIYEWYDFAVYGLLSSEIGACFFPKSDKKMQLIGSFGVFLAAFVMRPIGAILFGEIGDRMWGRKYALIMSIVLITVPSVLMGLLPSYNQIGIAAPIILILLRMAQGLSVGGQLAGSYVVSIEQSTVHNRGFRGSVCDSSSVGGFLLASLVTTIVRNICSKDQVDNWAWRIPFWFSLVLAPILYRIVSKTEESKFWSERNEQKDIEQLVRESENKTQTPAIYDLYSSPFYRRQLLGMVLVLSAMTSSFYTLMLWTPIYLSDLRGILQQKEADLINLLVVSIHITFVLLSGKLSDQFVHRSDLIKIGITGIITGAPVMFAMFECESKLGIFLAQVQFSVCMSLVHGGIAAWEVELWMPDPSLSFTGVAVGHNVAATIFGGTMPVVLTYLYYYSDGWNDDEEDLYKRLVPGFFVSMLGLLALYSIGYVVRHPHDLRTGDKQLKHISNLQEKIHHKKNKIKKKQEIKDKMDWMSPVLSWGGDGDSAVGESNINAKSNINAYANINANVMNQENNRKEVYVPPASLSMSMSMSMSSR